MAKEIPYFRFYPGEWFAGDITMLPWSARGVFIELCAYYWQKDCDITLAKVRQRFSKCLDDINLLLGREIFTVDSDEQLTISFLDEQYERALDISRKRSKYGRSGGVAKGKQKPGKSKAKVKQVTNIDKDKDKDKDKNKEHSRADGKKNGTLVEEIISYLNFISGKNFSAKTSETIKHINGRISEGRTLEEFKNVIDRKCDQWLGDKSMDKFIRPNTLFNQSKFDSYLNEKDDLREEGEERPLTEDEKYEQVKTNFYSYWDKVGSLKDALDKFASSPFIKTIYTEIRKSGLKKSDLTGKKPGEIIPGYDDLVAKLRGNDAK